MNEFTRCCRAGVVFGKAGISLVAERGWKKGRWNRADWIIELDENETELGRELWVGNGI